jgi:hypothetical protein
MIQMLEASLEPYTLRTKWKTWSETSHLGHKKLLSPCSTRDMPPEKICNPSMSSLQRQL